MARTLDRPKVHPEVHPDIHPDIHPGVDEFIKKTLEGETTAERPRRPIRWMRWLAAALLLMAAAGVALIYVSGGETDEAAPSTGPVTDAVPSGSPDVAETMTVDLPSGLTLEVPMAETMTVELPSGLMLEVPIVARDVLTIADYMPPESTGAVYNYNPARDVLTIADYMPPAQMTVAEGMEQAWIDNYELPEMTVAEGMKG